VGEPKAIYLTLQPAGMATPAKQVSILASQVVATALRAFDADDCSDAPAWTGAFSLQFTGFDLSPDERRAAFKSWVLAKGFQDLARGVRETLEEALFFLKMLQRPSPALTTMAELEGEMATIRTAAGKLSFPALLEHVNGGLTEPLAFEREFRSLQNVRNCLEHRAGYVGTKDVDPATGRLALSFPRMKLFYHRGEEEVEVKPGEAIGAQSPDAKLGQADVPIYFKRVTTTREYALHDPIIIGPDDFFQIAMACLQFADDVATKLPSSP
jgi:hypothetical protein